MSFIDFNDSFMFTLINLILLAPESLPVLLGPLPHEWVMANILTYNTANVCVSGIAVGLSL